MEAALTVTAPGATGAPAGRASRPAVAAPRVDVVVVAYNSRDTLRTCVEPLTHLPWVASHRRRQRVSRRLHPGRRGPSGSHHPLVQQRRLRLWVQSRYRRRASASSCCSSIRMPTIDAASLAALVDALRADPSLAGGRPSRRRRCRHRAVHTAAVPPPALDLRAGLVPAPSGAARGLDGRCGPRPQRVRAAGNTGVGLRMLCAPTSRGRRVGRWSGRRILPLRRGDRFVQTTCQPRDGESDSNPVPRRATRASVPRARTQPSTSVPPVASAMPASTTAGWSPPSKGSGWRSAR